MDVQIRPCHPCPPWILLEVEIWPPGSVPPGSDRATIGDDAFTGGPEHHAARGTWSSRPPGRDDFPYQPFTSLQDIPEVMDVGSRLSARGTYSDGRGKANFPSWFLMARASLKSAIPTDQRKSERVCHLFAASKVGSEHPS